MCDFEPGPKKDCFYDEAVWAYSEKFVTSKYDKLVLDPSHQSPKDSVCEKKKISLTIETKGISKNTNHVETTNFWPSALS